MAVCSQDHSFGPGSTCRDLDFTLRFEQTILSFLPDIVFLLLAATRLVFLSHRANKLDSVGSILIFAKCASTLLLVASTVANLKSAIDAKNHGVLALWLAAPVLQLIVSVPLAALVVLEHFRSSTPSVVVICYSLLKGLFTATSLRSYLQIGLPHDAHSVVLTCALLTASYFLVLCVELVEKRRLLRRKTLPTVSTASFISRSLYIWLLPLLWSGRKKTLTIDDCGTIPEGLTAQSSGSKLQKALSTTKKTPSYLIVASLKAFKLEFFAPIFPRIILVLATFAQPLLVNQTISFVSAPDRPISQGWALVGGFVCVYAIISLSTSLYWEKVFDVTVQYRGALVGAIYTKTLKLSSSASRSLGNGVASTYMSVDVERVCQGTEYIHEMWASLLSIALSIVVLYSQATWPAFLPIAVTALLILVSAGIGRSIGSHQAAWLAATDRRVKFLSSVITNFLPIKWSRYEDILSERAAQLRGQEMKEAKKFYNSISVTASLSSVAGTLCILSVLGPYAALAGHNGRGPLDPNRLFTIVATVNLLQVPLNLLGEFLPVIAASYASLKRIQGFLLLDEKPEDPNRRSEKDDDVNLSEKTGETMTPITMSSASFSWSPEDKAFLQGISINLDKPRLYMCVGPVASGKSLLLLSILGETIRTEGEYAPPSCRVAYAAQDALIVPGTIRENITFGKPYDEDRYQSVIEACALVPDIGRLQAGDGTYLGERGGRLSGGQKQRIALARAAYAEAPWTLLDDPLSALDAETEAHVFQSLFGNGGLLRGRAVLLVTHNVKHLSSADCVIVLNGGRVQHQGTLDEISKQGYNSAISLQLEKSEEGQENAKPVVQRGEEHVDEQEVEEAPLAKTSLGFTPYVFYARMATWKHATITMLVLVLSALMRLGLQFYLRQWSASNGANLAAWTGGYAGFSFAMLFVNIFCLWQFTTVVTSYTGKGLHSAEVKGLFGTAPSYLLATPAGRIINRFSQDIFLVDFEFPVYLMNGLLQVVTLIGTVVFIFIPIPWLTLSIIPLGIFYYASLVFYTQTSKQLQHLEASSKSPLYTVFSSTLSGLSTIRALHVEPHFQTQNDWYLDRSQKPFYFRFSGMRFLRTILSLISLVVAVGLAALSVGLRNSTDPSFLGLALSSLTSLSQLLSSLLMSLANIENGSIAISRIHEIASLPVEEETAIVSSPQPDSDWPSHGTIVFEDVQLRYKADLDPALRGVSFQVQAGTKIGICGRSGSGKSSLILALFRALDKSLMSGRIAIDGVDISTLPLSTLRQSLSLVAQDPFLWHSSLRDNLDPEKRLAEKDIWMALKRVGMSDAVSALPDKLDCIIEDGGSFSKGQQQLICLARVLLRSRKIVILDEASSSLDHETDEKMREVISSELAHCTVLSVAHRIATIIDFDWILVMDGGIIVESGTPQELLAQPDSKFALLAYSQGLGHDKFGVTTTS